MKTVYVYASDTMADWEPAYVLPELHTGRLFKHGMQPYAIKTCALSPEPIVSMGGLRIVPDVLIEEVEPAVAALLLLPGGNTWLEARHAPILQKAAEFVSAGVPVAAICGATLALAKAGMLDNIPHTSNDLAMLKAMVPHYKGESNYRHEPAVTGNNIITAAGLAPLDFACHILKKLEVVDQEVLDVWYNLCGMREPRYYFALMQLLQSPQK